MRLIICPLLAYTIAADLPGGLLVYAAGEAQPTLHHVVRAEKDLEVVTLDPSAARRGTN